MPADGARPLILEIARIGLEVRTADPALRLVAEPAHLPFLAEATGEDCASVTLGPASRRQARKTSGKTLFETGSVWRLEEVGDNRLLTFRSPLFGKDPYLSVEFDREYARGEGETLVGGPILAAGELHPFVYPFDEVVFLARLSRERGVLVHACGLALGGRGLLFLGTSGAGKSTTARLWKERGGVTILSDDRIVIRAEGDGYRGDQALHRRGPDDGARLPCDVGPERARVRRALPGAAVRKRAGETPAVPPRSNGGRLRPVIPG